MILEYLLVFEFEHQCLLASSLCHMLSSDIAWQAYTGWTRAPRRLSVECGDSLDVRWLIHLPEPQSRLTKPTHNISVFCGAIAVVPRFSTRVPTNQLDTLRGICPTSYLPLSLALSHNLSLLW